MLTFQSLYGRVKKIVSQDGTGNDTFIKELVNESNRYVCDLRDWWWLEDTITRVTTADTNTIDLPADYGRLLTYRITNAGIDYTPEEIADPVKFDRLNYNGTNVTSDYPVYFHIRNGQIINYPAFSTSDLTVTIEYVRIPVDMTADDYTTGTISAIANGAKAVTGSGTTWTSAMVGRYIKMPDGIWYKIAAFGTTTTITLDKAYQGSTIAAGSASYIIGEVSPIPEAYQDLIWLRSASVYYMMKSDENRADYYDSRFDKMLMELKRRYSTKTARNTYSTRGAHPYNSNYDPRAVSLTAA